jgi:hypothetical protein
MRNSQWIPVAFALVAACASSPTGNPPLDGAGADESAKTDVPTDMVTSDNPTDVAPQDVPAGDRPTVDAPATDVPVVDVPVADVTTDVARDVGADVLMDVSTDAGADVALDARPDVVADIIAPDAATDALADVATDAASGPAVELWVLRVGDGMAALTNAATPIFIERRASTDGAMRGATLALPTATSGTNHPVTLSGTATSEGSLTRSGDGRSVTLAGYATAPGTAGVASSTTDTVQRVAVMVRADGSVDSSTLLGMAYGANNVRGAATVDGAGFWTAGTAATATLGGVQYKARGAAGEPTSVVSAPSNVRTLGIFGTQLYGASSNSTFYGIFSVGTGTPTMSSTATILPGFATTSGPSPYAFVLLDRDAAVAGVDAAYVADDRAPASGGGVQRWTLSAGTWTLGATFNMGITSGVRGVTAWVEGGEVAVATVTGENPSRLVLYRDRAGTMPGMPVVLATAPMNTQFRGVALAPTP